VFALLRILAMNEEDVKKNWQKTLTGEYLDEEIKQKVLDWRQQLIQRLLESYEEADNLSGNDCFSLHGQLSLNMELALQLRIQEKQIFKSVLNLAKIS